MLNKKLLNRVHCIKCANNLASEGDDILCCKSCGASYSSTNDIPQLIEGIPVEEQEWNEWNTAELIKKLGIVIKNVRQVSYQKKKLLRVIVIF